jgi:hypothetical protein
MFMLLLKVNEVKNLLYIFNKIFKKKRRRSDEKEWGKERGGNKAKVVGQLLELPLERSMSGQRLPVPQVVCINP